MSKLQFFCVVYTRGDAPRAVGTDVRGIALTVTELTTFTMPVKADELFGPHVADFLAFKPARAFLISVKATQGLATDIFFENTRSKLLEICTGVTGFTLDILRLQPLPNTAFDQLVPYDVMGEDLFSISFTDRGDHGIRAETFGLAKLGQAELMFDFKGRDLQDDAAQLVSRIADWVFQHRRVMNADDVVPFGFDSLKFTGANALADGSHRGWHRPLVLRLLGAELFSGTGVVTVTCVTSGETDLTNLLARVHEQQQVLSKANVIGDSPHHARTALVKGLIRELRNVEAVRSEPTNSRDSGWAFRHTEQSSVTTDTPPLSELVRLMPELIGYLALPPGSIVWWNAEGRPVTTVSDAHGFEEMPTGEIYLGAEK